MIRRLGASLALLAGTLTACSSSSGTATSAGGDSYSIGIVKFASSDPASEGVIAGYVDYATSQGWDVSTVDPQGSADQAISGINNFVQKKVDLIVVAVFPSSGLTAGVLTAKAADIPLISIGGGTADGVPVSLDFGRLQDRPIAELLVEDTGGTGDLLVLGYTPGLPCVGREEELMSQLEGTAVRVTRKEVPVPGQVEAGTQFAQAWLASHPAGSGPLAIWGCFDDPAVGAVAALRQTGRSDVLVYGHDGTPAGVKATQAGDMRATAFFDPEAEGTKLGEGTPDVIQAGVGAVAQMLPPTIHVVTKDNVADILTQFPKVLG